MIAALHLTDQGHAPSIPLDWIAALRPQALLLSVAAGDKDGRPDLETVAAIQGYTLLRTNHNGWIELTTDDEQMWVQVEKRGMPSQLHNLLMIQNQPMQ